MYAASGRFTKDPKVFALSDFLPALGEQIEIRSERPVLSYVHVGTMMRLFWAMLAEPADRAPAGGCGAAVRVAG